MSKRAFLEQFLDEEIYLIQEDALKEEPESVNEVTEDVQEPAPAYTTIGLNYKGGNEKHIAILVNDASSEFINDIDLNFLLKILSAIKLSLDDVAIINLHNSPVNSMDQLSHLSCKKCLLFEPNSTLMRTPNYEMHTIEGIDVAKGETLKFISENVEEKRRLWSLLQKEFS